MNSNSSRFLISLACAFSIAAPAFAAEKQSQPEKAVDLGQKAFDSGNYLKAERSWVRAQTEFSKGSPDEKFAHLLLQLGDCYSKEGKYALAETSYKKSGEMMQGLSLDPADSQAKLKELSVFFRPINLEGFDENASAFAKQVGALCASAMNKDEKRHIDISLKQKFQQGIKDLIESAPTGATGMTPEQLKEAEAKMNSSGSPPLKQIRLDKQIAFDVEREDATGKMTLANIQGIFLNVGLWVKLKAFAMMLNEQNNPIAEVTAGAFGVEKKVRVDLPQNLFGRLKEGINKFDPFATMIHPAVAATTTPANKATAASSPTAPVNPSMPVSSNASTNHVDPNVPATSTNVPASTSSAMSASPTTTPSGASSMPATSTLPSAPAPEL